MLFFAQLFNIDNLSLIMLTLIGFITICVIAFSLSYLKGDRKQKQFYSNITIMILSVLIMVCADNLILLLLSWAISNIFLVKLMLHKKEWNAASKSAFLALKNFCLGLFFLTIAFFILYKVTGEISIYEINKSSKESFWLIPASIFILLAAMTQSAIWPFHRWLISSLNSPTNVSAIMHAGLVNGGGFILVRFAPIFLDQPIILNIIFTIGIITALIGTIWKLMQSDVKRMLACSTMGQMGFMIAQCGLGLFPAAVAHLCLHGLFKSYLFLSSGSAAQEKRLDLDYPPSLKHFFIALIFGLIGAYLFTITSNKNIFAGDTTLFLVILILITATQFSLPIICRPNSIIIKLTISLITTLIVGTISGLSVGLIELILKPLYISKPQDLNIIHNIALTALISCWLTLLFIPKNKELFLNNCVLKIYVRLLNSSQPHPKTITSFRNHYKF